MATKIRYENRKCSILKKCKELSTLCDVKLCVIVISPDGKLETWPDNLNDVKAVLSAVKGSRKPIRSENLRNKKDSGDRRLGSRIKIPKSVKGKEIDDRENCVFGNVAACVVDEEVFYDVSGADQVNNNAQRDKFDVYNNFGMGIPAMSLADMTVNQTPSTDCPNTDHYYNNHWNGDGKSNCEKFGKYIGDMVTNQEPNLAYYGCGMSSSSAMNPKTQFCNMQLEPNQELSVDYCYGRRYEMGSSSRSAFNSGLNFSNMAPPIQEPSSLIAYHQQRVITQNVFF